MGNETGACQRTRPVVEFSNEAGERYCARTAETGVGSFNPGVGNEAEACRRTRAVETGEGESRLIQPSVGNEAGA